MRPVTYLPTNLLAPTVISGKQETAKEETVVRACMSTDKPEKKEASKRPVCWQIRMEEEWIPLAEANDEIEKAYQSQEDEYITEVMINNDVRDSLDQLLWARRCPLILPLMMMLSGDVCDEHGRCIAQVL